MQTIGFLSCVKFRVREGVKKTRLFKGNVHYQGKGRPPPTKKIDFLLKPLCCIVTPSRSTGANEIHIKIKENKHIF